MSWTGMHLALSLGMKLIRPAALLLLPFFGLACAPTPDSEEAETQQALTAALDPCDSSDRAIGLSLSSMIESHSAESGGPLRPGQRIRFFGSGFVQLPRNFEIHWNIHAREKGILTPLGRFTSLPDVRTMTDTQIDTTVPEFDEPADWSAIVMAGVYAECAHASGGQVAYVGRMTGGTRLGGSRALLKGKRIERATSRPRQPQNVRVSVNGSDSLLITWADGTNEENYGVDVRLPTGALAASRTLPQDSTRTVVDRLAPGTAYDVYVYAENSRGSSPKSGPHRVVLPASNPEGAFAYLDILDHSIDYNGGPQVPTTNPLSPNGAQTRFHAHAAAAYVDLNANGIVDDQPTGEAQGYGNGEFPYFQYFTTPSESSGFLSAILAPGNQYRSQGGIAVVLLLEIEPTGGALAPNQYVALHFTYDPASGRIARNEGGSGGDFDQPIGRLMSGDVYGMAQLTLPTASKPGRLSGSLDVVFVGAESYSYLDANLDAQIGIVSYQTAAAVSFDVVAIADR